MMFLAICLYLYSFIQFAKMIGQILVHDVSAKVFDDYQSDKRNHQRTGALKSFGKSVLAFALAGMCVMFNI